jgi:hypothetical protein
MAKDKYTAVWISHTSISDYLKCPRSYFLKNVYKDTSTGRKIQIISPSLALGQAVHEVLDSLSGVPTEKRLDESLVIKFDRAWEKVSGGKGGFKNTDDEHKFKERGKAMLRRVMDNPGPIIKLAVKIQQDLPHYWISEDENIVLCGKVDWLEYETLTRSTLLTSKQEKRKKTTTLFSCRYTTCLFITVKKGRSLEPVTGISKPMTLSPKNYFRI